MKRIKVSWYRVHHIVPVYIIIIMTVKMRSPEFIIIYDRPDEAH